jgi:hypothetical protein
MLGMYCNTCGGSMLGDGVTAVIHCERLSALDFTVAPDSVPVHCTPDPVDGDILTPAQVAAGWHYCSAFDGLLTKGERPEGGGCFCASPTERIGFNF